MIYFFLTLLFVIGLLALEYLHYKHILKLEVLLRVENPHEFPDLIKKIEAKTSEEVPIEPPGVLDDLFDGHSAEQIRESFRKPE